MKRESTSSLQLPLAYSFAVDGLACLKQLRSRPWTSVAEFLDIRSRCLPEPDCGFIENTDAQKAECTLLTGSMFGQIEQSRLLPEQRAFATFTNRKKAR